METQPRISPNGQWLAYASDESGDQEGYVRPFPGPGGRVQVSSGGGQWPLWWPDSKRLLYLQGDTVMAVDLSTTPLTRPVAARGVSVLKRQRVFDGEARTRVGAVDDVHPDGRRYTVVRDAGEAPAIVVVINWLTELRARIAASQH